MSDCKLLVSCSQSSVRRVLLSPICELIIVLNLLAGALIELIHSSGVDLPDLSSGGSLSVVLNPLLVVFGVTHCELGLLIDNTEITGFKFSLDIVPIFL